MDEPLMDRLPGTGTHLTFHQLVDYVLQVEQRVNRLAEAVHGATHPEDTVEPLLELPVVAALVPIELDRMKYAIKWRNDEYPKIYRLDRNRRRRRMLPLSCVRQLRRQVLRGPDLEQFC